MNARQIYDPFLAQYSYLVGSEETGEAILIDPQRDVDRYVDAAEEAGFRLAAAFETHMHADFVSGLRECAERGIPVYASAEGGPEFDYEWLENSCYDATLLSDGDTVSVGTLTVEAMHTPGHSPEHLTYLIRDAAGDGRMAAATGDFLFVEGLGRPRLVPDPGPSEADTEASFAQSLRAFRGLPESTEVWPLHGAGTRCGYAPSPWPTSTVAYEKTVNPVVRAAAGSDRDVSAALHQPYPDPPAYFSRVKALNRSGPPLLDALPRPSRATPQELLNLTKGRGVVFIDTRTDRTDFLRRHLPGSLHAPLDPSFLSVVGSYVSPSTPIYLILEEDDLDRAVRALARIGLDDVAGYSPPSALDHLPGGSLKTTPTVTFSQFNGLLPRSDVYVVDVRGSDAYAAGHVDGALNVPFLNLGAPRNCTPALQVPPDATVLVYSETGRRAAIAGAYLERRGYHVAAVDDSYRHWERELV